MALAFLAAAIAPSYWTLLAALAVFGPACGCAVGLSQATLVDTRPERRDQALARWSFAATLGDLAAPALLAGLDVFALGHRAALLVAAVVSVALAALAARALADEPRAEAEHAVSTSLRQAWRDAWSTPGLVLWALGCLLCTLMDETLVAFGAAHMHHALGATPTARAIAFAAWTAGSLVGLAALDRLLARARPLRLLAVSASACAAFHVAWLAIPSPIAAVVGLFGVGLTACVHYPIAKAQAYAAAPGRSGLVNAAISALLPLEIAAPAAIGAVADHLGTRSALLVLLAQPLGLLVIATISARRSASVP
jgi:predicted MFS family arabinose efflux permease